MITWNVLRAAGIGAYLMLWASVAWGLLGTSTVVGKRFAKPSITLIHQFFSTLGLLFLLVHLGGLFIDEYMEFDLLDLMWPGATDFRPVAVTLGIISMYLMFVILGSSWARKRMGPKLWRALHALAIPAFILALGHGVLAGTDTARPWMWGLYVLTGGITLFLTVVRAWAIGKRPQRAAKPDHAAKKPAVAKPAATKTAAPKPEAPKPGAPRTEPKVPEPV